MSAAAPKDHNGLTVDGSGSSHHHSLSAPSFSSAPRLPSPTPGRRPALTHIPYPAAQREATRAEASQPQLASPPSRRSARSALAVQIPAYSLAPPVCDAALQYAEEEQQPPVGSQLGDLTPTSNTTPSPSTPLPPSQSSSCSRSPSPSTPSSAASGGSLMSLPPLSISPRVLDALHHELAEKSQLLALANSHISHQSVQIGHLQHKLQSYADANSAMLTAGVGAGGGPAVGALGRGEEVRQLRVLLTHLHGMLAQRDEIIAEQEKELCYYQEQVRQWKASRERELEREGERDRERDRDKERMRQLEAELQRWKDKDRREREERRDQQQQQQQEERKLQQDQRAAEEEQRRRSKEEQQDEQKMPDTSTSSSSAALTLPQSPSQASSASSQPSLLSLPPSPLSSASSCSSSSLSSPCGDAAPAVLSPSQRGTTLSPAPGAASPHGLLPKVRRSSNRNTAPSALNNVSPIAQQQRHQQQAATEPRRAG